jgi:hypothetical protein
MEAINDLVSSTKKDLWIVVDVPGYASFSNPLAYQAYRMKLESLANPANNLQIKMVIYDFKRRSEAFKRQFKIDDFEDFKNDPRYRRYFAFWGNRKTEPKTKDEFPALLEAEYREFLNRLGNLGVEIHETESTLPLFMWVSDERRAIFSLIDYPYSSNEVSFRTNDLQLINILLEIAKGTFKESKEHKGD